MEQFILSTFITITGIGATSGICLIEKDLYLISDNSSYLYQYNLTDKQLNKIRLQENSQENMAKKDKLDFETLAKKENTLFLFGSGSTSKREKRFSYNLKTKEIKEKKLTKIYQNFREIANLGKSALNIEGAILTPTTKYYFQRGNEQNSQNGIFRINTNKEIDFIQINLPKTQNIEATFTDAIAVKNKIYFLAAIENTTSTYNDGEILGSFLGRLDTETLKLEFVKEISKKHKFEGITVYQKTANSIEFLICEDNDTEKLQTTIYKLVYNF